MALYSDVDTLRLVLDSTDAGTGTAAQLSDAQLTQALTYGTDRVSTYAGTVFDPAAAAGQAGYMPGIVADLAIDIAAWYATTIYLKHKGLAADSPVALRYAEAKAILEAVRKGEVSLDVATEAAASAKIINRIPGIFTNADTDTVFDPSTGYLQTDTSVGSSAGTRQPGGPFAGLLDAELP
jgi:phage gp36-like protein